MHDETNPLILPLFALGITSCFIQITYIFFNSIKPNSQRTSTALASTKKTIFLLLFFSLFTGIFSLLSLFNLVTSSLDTIKMMVYFIGLSFVGIFIYTISYCLSIKKYSAVFAFGLLIFLILNAFAYDLFKIPMIYDQFNLIWVARVILFLLFFATFDNARFYGQFKNQPSYANIRKNRAFILWLINASVHYLSAILFILSWFFSFPG